MQVIAREFNLSETVFVHPPADAGHRAAVRIFTPGRELPFAGHPTVGTAVLLGRLDGGAGEHSIALEEKVGLVRCRVKAISTDSGHATFQLPQLPEIAGEASDNTTIAAALSLSA